MADLHLNWEQETWPDGRPYWRASVDHSLNDEKGRSVGGYAFIYQFPVGEAARAAGYDSERAGKFNLAVHATRDGQRYGATPYGRLFATLAQAQEAAGPALLRQRKSYLRKYAQSTLFDGLGAAIASRPTAPEPESLSSVW